MVPLTFPFRTRFNSAAPKNLLLRDITLCEKERGRISTRLVGWGSLSSSGSPVFATHNATHNRRDLHVFAGTWQSPANL